MSALPRVGPTYDATTADSGLCMRILYRLTYALSWLLYVLSTPELLSIFNTLASCGLLVLVPSMAACSAPSVRSTFSGDTYASAPTVSTEPPMNLAATPSERA